VETRGQVDVPEFVEDQHSKPRLLFVVGLSSLDGAMWVGSDARVLREPALRERAPRGRSGEGGADAALLDYGHCSVRGAKERLRAAGIPVRL
jgi:hypothetical protein